MMGHIKNGRNGRIRDRAAVVEAEKRAQGRQFHWHEHVIRRVKATSKKMLGLQARGVRSREMLKAKDLRDKRLEREMTYGGRYWRYDAEAENSKQRPLKMEKQKKKSEPFLSLGYL